MSTPAGSSVDHEVGTGCAAALAGLPSMGPRRLTALLDAWSPHEAWERAGSGRLELLRADPSVAALLGDSADSQASLARSWAGAARSIDPVALAGRHRSLGIAILLRDDPAYPQVLLEDIEPPAVLFSQGSLAALDARRVAVVGTRRCTGVGAGFARQLGRDLAAQGIAVVSGLALGIDGAAHRGVLDEADDGAAAPVGVVGCGLDVVYPSRHRELWAAVAARGVLLGEAPLGQRPNAWRFPARNRIIAALAELVIVVESHDAGGSLHTVAEAIRRDTQVMAVPGSVRNPAAAGTNQLLADGCHPVRDVSDVVVALGLASAPRRAGTDRRPPPDAVGRAVLDAFGWEPATLDHLAVRSGLGLAQLATTLEWLQDKGWAVQSGGWYERVGSP